MDRSQNSESDANSFTQSFVQKIDGPLCHCNRATVMSKSWTDDNPGRRFFRCDVHGFFIWADIEKPNGWQKVSLLEARDQIRRLKEDIKGLRAVKLSTSVADSTMMNSGLWKNIEEEKKKLEEEKKKLENDALTAKEKEKLLCQFIVLSWGGFIVVTAMILKMV